MDRPVGNIPFGKRVRGVTVSFLKFGTVAIWNFARVRVALFSVFPKNKQCTQLPTRKTHLPKPMHRLSCDSRGLR